MLDIALIAIVWTFIGFPVGSLNYLLFRHTGSDREFFFYLSLVLWPIVLVIDLFVLFSRSGYGLDGWFRYLEDYHNKRVMKKRQKHKQISA